VPQRARTEGILRSNLLHNAASYSEDRKAVSALILIRVDMFSLKSLCIVGLLFIPSTSLSRLRASKLVVNVGSVDRVSHESHAHIRGTCELHTMTHNLHMDRL